MGTTIYPGMQFTAVWIKNHVLPDWSLNDVCVFLPAWFGVIATIFTGAIAYEVSIPVNSSGSLLQWLSDLWNGTKTPNQVTSTSMSPALESAVFAMGIMAIVPAHLMRSMGGGYDNESVAVTAMVSTFYFWVRSLRGGSSYLFGFATALCYFYMVASWGGYIFVLNLIGCHAAFLVAAGRFDKTVWACYTIFYALGTALAIQVPVVGWAPLKSLEQLGPFVVFGVYQLLYISDTISASRKLNRSQSLFLRVQILVAAAVAGVVLAAVVAPSGYFGPISSRVRGLFVKHTKTGNPLVDSVAEHQPASSRAYFQYLHHACTLAPIGFLLVGLTGLSDASSFMVVWGAAAYFFSHKMVRLILLTGPIAAVLGGIVGGRLLCWCIRQWWEDASAAKDSSAPEESSTPAAASKGPKRKKQARRGASSESSSFDGLVSLQKTLESSLKTKQGVVATRLVSILLIGFSYLMILGFTQYCWMLGEQLSNPSIIVKARTREGQIIKVDDYREAYWWLRDNTPEDARVMAWWDYGYQISAIANRTTIADGNTWNHEHIALLGKALTTDLDTGYEIARHLADYVLVWGGGGGDDLAKSPHLARIANSVYRDHCPDDPTCRAFGFLDRQGTPSAMMERSFLYKLHSSKIRPGVEAPADKFKEVYKSKYGKVRIYKLLGVDEESKRWVADPANRRCDAPGSWFCPGQYPPGLSAFLSKKKDFSQLEDFNKREGEGDDEYTKKYFEDLHNPDSARRKALEKERKAKLEADKETAETKEGEEKETHDEEKLQALKDQMYNSWQDTEDTTRMWTLINSNNIAELQTWLAAEPHKAFIRSKDGRGPMFWAFEQRQEAITKLLMQAGVPHTDRDANGQTPVDLLEGSSN